MLVSSTKRPVVTKPQNAAFNDEEDLRRLRIGPRIHTIRRLRAMTLNNLAALTGYSASLLSRIENEKTVPSIPTLLRLSKALEIDLISFFKGYGDSDVLTKQHERESVKGLRHSEGTELEILVAPADDRLLEAFLVKLRPGGHGGKPISHEGEEMGYVIEGKLELTVAGRTYLAAAGDSFHFPSNLEHSYRNTGDGVTTVVWVNTPPPRTSRLRARGGGRFG